MTTIQRFAAIAAMTAAVAGCAGPTPTIDKSAFTPPKSVTIVEPPRMRTLALISPGAGLRSDFAYAHHFSKEFDDFFVLEPNGAATLPGAPPLPAYDQQILLQQSAQVRTANQSVGSAAMSGAVGGAMAGLIQASAEKTARKAREFDNETRARVPDLDLRRDIIQALKETLERRGVAVSIIKNAGTSPPRLRWPAPGMQGSASVAEENAPPVDTDLLIQLSPATEWYAPGPLNNFRRSASIGVVIYNGRTKAYLGSQAFWYQPPTWEHEYVRYESLVADAAAASQAMRDGVLSIVPQIADAITTPAAPSPR